MYFTCLNLESPHRYYINPTFWKYVCREQIVGVGYRNFSSMNLLISGVTERASFGLSDLQGCIEK